MSSLGNEVCKNILLAGIKHLTILDDKDMTKKDFEAQFFSSEEDVGKNVSFIEFWLYFLYKYIKQTQITKRPEFIES